MRSVTLPNSRETTVLGYGCASLMARLNRRESLRLLDVAHDAGVTHFDTARSYGYGEAESVLGEFIRMRRDAVTVTTKLGIAPPAHQRRIAVLKSVARQVVRVSPGLRRRLRARAGQLQSGGQFTVPQARASLETSLRELGTDRVDVLLLHECSPADLTPDLLEFLHDCVAQGKVGQFGLATDPGSSLEAAQHAPEFTRVVQIANSVAARNLDRLSSLRDSFFITHSPLSSALPTVERDVTVDPAELPRMCLAWALRANPGGITLFSSTDEDRIRANCAVAEGAAPDDERLARLEQLVARG